MTKYAVVSVYADGDREVVAECDNIEDAEQILFKCKEGDDKHDRCDYEIEELKVLRVVVVFEFNNVGDPDNPSADEIVQAISSECETMKIGFDASACYIDEVTV